MINTNGLIAQIGIIAASGQAGTVAPVVPSIGIITSTPTTGEFNPTSDTTTYTWSHTRASGTGLDIRLTIRGNAGTNPTITGVTFGGVAATVQAQDKDDGAGNLVAVLVTMDPGVGPTGTNDIVVTLSGNDGRDAAGHAADIIGTSGFETGSTNASVNTISDGGSTTITGTITPANAKSLLLSTAACRDGTVSVTAQSGWMTEDSAVSAADSNGITSLLQSLAPDTTSVQTGGGTFGSSVIRRALTLGEWLPS